MSLLSKIIPFEELSQLSNKLRSEKMKLITTNGCFDLLHLGHIHYLEKAKQLGDVLIVGINSDDSVKSLNKSPGRPIFDETVRAKQVAALSCVDYVAVFNQPTPNELLNKIKPDIHVKGGDYKGKRLPEETVLESNGGQLVLIDLLEGFSTTGIIEKLQKQ